MQDSDGTGRSSINCDNGSLNLKFNSNNAVGTSVLTFNDFNTERMRIDSSGNVGIGTSSPDKLLTLSASNPQIRMYDTDGTNQLLDIVQDGNASLFTSRNNTSHGQFVFRTYNGTSVAERMRIDASGNVGIGTSSPAGALHVSRSGLEAGITLERTTSATAKFTMAANDGKLVFTDQNQSETRMVINSSGNVGIGTSSPQGKLQVKGDSNADVFYLTDANEDDRGLMFSNSSNGIVWDIDAKGASGSFGQISFSTNSSEAARIDSSGNVGIGTSSPAEKLHGHNGSGNDGTYLRLSGGGSLNESYGGFVRGFGVSGAGGRLQMGVVDAGTKRVGIEIQEQGNQIIFDTAGSEAMRIGSNGDILAKTIDARIGSDVGAIEYGTSTANSVRFYSNNTERMRIDSSGKVGIGTSSPARELTVKGGLLGFRNDTTGYASSDGFDIGISGGNAYLAQRENAHIIIETNSTERMRIDASGNVGIGTSSPNSYSGQTTLNINSTGVARLDLDINNSVQGYLLAESGYTGLFAHSSSNHLSLGTNSIERMRIDSSGNVLVGTTEIPANLTGTSTESGIGFDGTSGYGVFVRNESVPLYANRLGSDGDIISLRKDGTTVGSIGTKGDRMNIGTGDAGLRFDNSNNAILPWNMTTDSGQNGTISLGAVTNYQFKDLYLSGGIYSGGAIDSNEYILNDGHNGRITYGTAPHGVSNSATTIEIHADAAVEIHERDDTNHMVWRVSTNDGQMQVPLQPSFTAYRNQAYALGNGDVEVSFNVALYNVGNNYNTSGSRFTAPVDGMYHFTTTISGYSTSTTTLEHTDDSKYLTFKKNGARITGRNAGSASAMFNWGYLTKNGVEAPVHISMNIQLDANEYVEVEAGDISSALNYVVSNAVFSGYLIG